MYTVHMIGLMYFKDFRNEQLVLAPNGMHPPMEMPPHRASFFIGEDDLIDAETSWWDKYQKRLKLTINPDTANERTAYVWQYLVPGTEEVHGPTFTISGSDVTTEAGLDLRDFHAKIPHLHAMEPNLHIAAQLAHTVAEIPIRTGALRFYRYIDGGAAQLTVDYDEKITIAAKGAGKQIVLKPNAGKYGTEIVFANAAKLLDDELDGVKGARQATNHGPHGMAMRHMSHFQIYGELDANRNPGRLHDPEYVTKEQIRFDHDYLIAVVQQQETPGTSCSPGCC